MKKLRKNACTFGGKTSCTFPEIWKKSSEFFQGGVKKSRVLFLTLYTYDNSYKIKNDALFKVHRFHLKCGIWKWSNIAMRSLSAEETVTKRLPTVTKRVCWSWNVSLKAAHGRSWQLSFLFQEMRMFQLLHLLILWTVHKKCTVNSVCKLTNCALTLQLDWHVEIVVFSVSVHF